MQYVTILGSTGTIGQQTLDVIAQHTDKYAVFALAANSKVDAIFKQCLAYQPQFAVLLDEAAAKQLRVLLNDANSKTQVLSGMGGLEQVSSDAKVNMVMRKAQITLCNKNFCTLVMF